MTEAERVLARNTAIAVETMMRVLCLLIRALLPGHAAAEANAAGLEVLSQHLRTAREQVEREWKLGPSNDRG